MLLRDVRLATCVTCIHLLTAVAKTGLFPIVFPHRLPNYHIMAPGQTALEGSVTFTLCRDFNRHQTDQ